RLLSFPLAWTSFEWLRSWFPVAFPWNPLGNAIYRELPMIQIAEVVGVFGVSALLVAVNVAIWIACSRVAQASACDLRAWIQGAGARWWVRRREEPNPQPLPWEGRGVGIEAGTSDLTPRPPVPRERGSFSENHRLKPVPLGAVGLVAVVLGSTFAFGVFKIRQFDHLPVAGRIKVAMVQGNIPQRVKWDPKALPGTFKIYSDASLEAAQSHPDLIIWPETATGFLFQPVNFYPAAARVKQEHWDKVTGLAAAAGVPMLIGAPALDIDLNFKQPQSRELPMRNRAYLLGADGRVGEFYDKIELVPVGEYVPAWPLAKG